MLVVGPERRRQDEPARVAPRRHAGLLAADARRRAADPLRRRRPPASRLAATAARSPVAARGDARRAARASARARTARALRAAEQLRQRAATLVFTPDRLAVVKGGPAARRAYFDRVARPPAARARGAAGASTAPRSRSGTPRCGASRRALGARRARAVDGAGRRARRGARRARAARRSRCSSRPSPSAPASSASPARALALRGRAADRAALEARLDARPRARRDGARAAPRRRRRRRRRARPAQLRLAGRAAPGRARAAARRGRAARRAPRRAAAAPARRRALGARPGAPPDARRRGSRRAARRSSPRRRPTRCPSSRRSSLEVARAAVTMEPLGDRRRAASCARFGAAGRDGRRSSRPGRRRSARRSPATRGRRGSRATGRCTSHTARSAWAFELGQLAGEIAPAGGSASRAALRFAPGRCRSRATAERRPGTVPPTLGRRTTRAAALTPRGSRTKSCAKRSQSGRGEPREGRGRPLVLIHFSSPQSAAFAGLFSWLRTAYTAKDITVLEGLEPVRLRRACTSARRARAASTTSSTRSSTTPSTRRSRAATTRSRSRIHPDNSVTVARRGSRHPGRHDGGAGAVGADGRPDEAARRRQVRRRRLQGLGRPARRRRLGRQRALGVARSPRCAATARSTARSSRAASRRARWRWSAIAKDTGTTITFLPDARDLRGARVSTPTRSSQRLRETAFLTRACASSSTDERAEGKTVEFHYEGGIQGLRRLHERVQGRRSTSTSSTSRARTTPATSRSRCSGTRPTRSRSSRSPTTSTRTRAARTSPGFRAALTRTLNKYARDKGLLKEKEDNLEGEDVREGLAAVISVKLANPQFEGQTKTKLGNPRVAASSSRPSTRGSREFLEENPHRREADHAQGGRRVARAPGGPQGARPDAPQERARRRRRCRASSPTARSRDPESAELFIVEGDSAGGSAKDGARPHATRRSCRCAGRSSTARRTASTRCSRTPRSRR